MPLDDCHRRRSTASFSSNPVPHSKMGQVELSQEVYDAGQEVRSTVGAAVGQGIDNRIVGEGRHGRNFGRRVRGLLELPEPAGGYLGVAVDERRIAL